MSLALGLLAAGLAVISTAHVASAAGRPRDAGCAPTALAGFEPSHQAPPAAHALAGYTRAYCTDFVGAALPSGWGRFSGVPQGDPSGYFDPAHVVVGHGILSLNTAHDPAAGGGWATGGVCQCGVARTYGTYLVRSRLTGAGDDEVQMLWPVAHVWPPEVDFNETGQHATDTAWYVHYSATNRQLAHTLKVNLMKWHTWGVIWTSTSITFTVDGKTWGSVSTPSAVPHESMTLDMSQQTWCGIAPECPTKPVSMQVDWVAEFTKG